MFTRNSDIKFVGVNDDKIDLFEGQYPVPEGISYNSYIIDSGEIAVMDSVDVNFGEVWLSQIDRELDGRSPGYIVVQHVEPDHSGSLELFLRKYPEAKVVATVSAVNMLQNFIRDVDVKERSVTVRDGDTLTVGTHVLRFLTAPLVHWPEVMVTLDESNGVLFSADAFGTFSHYDTLAGWDDEARRYYCNIVGKFGRNVQNLLAKIKDLKFNTVAPLHGPVLTENLAHYWTLYDKWSSYTPERKGVLVAYASVYGGTAKAARELAMTLCERGAEVKVIDLCREHFSLAVAEAFRYDSMALCAVTYDGDLFPPMYNFLHHLALKNFGGRKVAVIENGSWAPVAGRKMIEMIKEMKNMTVVSPVVTIKSRMSEIDRLTMAGVADELVR